MNPHPPHCQLILVLDLPTEQAVFTLLDRVGASVEWVKVGLQLFVRYGTPLVDKIAGRGYKVFLDLKLHDIPNTVAAAIQNLEGAPIHMLTLHTAGGSEMLQRACEAQQKALPDTLLLGVTVLTSMDQAALQAIGCADAVDAQVLRLGRMAQRSGIEGLVCSPLELPLLRDELGQELTLVTPGIRPKGSASDDQKRTLTPAQAAAAGSSFIVVGRPILKAADPHAAALQIQTELSSHI